MSIITDLATYSFLQRALLGGIAIALCCALLGTILVLRRLSLIGEGIAHLAFGGLAVGIYLGVPPIASALVVAILGSLWVQRIVARAQVYADAAIAVIIATGLSTGIILIGVAKGFTVDLFSYLFGSILTLGVTDVWLCLAALALVAVFIATQYRRLVLITFNEELARVQGVPVERITAALAVLTACAVIVAMRAVGILLVSALLVLPALCALQVSRSFAHTLLLATCISLCSVVVGTLLAFSFNIPVGGAIVALLVLAFAGTLGWRRLRSTAGGSRV